jgi:hypothetical protein
MRTESAVMSLLCFYVGKLVMKLGLSSGLRRVLRDQVVRSVDNLLTNRSTSSRSLQSSTEIDMRIYWLVRCKYM